MSLSDSYTVKFIQTPEMMLKAISNWAQYLNCTSYLNNINVNLICNPTVLRKMDFVGVEVVDFVENTVELLGRI